MIVGLKSGRDSYHNWVIVERTRAGDYRTVTKYGDKTIEITNTKARIKRMKGTDIGTYTLAKRAACGHVTDRPGAETPRKSERRV